MERMPEISASTAEWLLAAPEPYIRYQAQALLAPDKADPRALDADPYIQASIEAVSGWREEVLARHDKADLCMHRLAMLAELGVTRETAGMGPIVEGLLSSISADGSFLIRIMVPKAFGGSGEAHDDWVMCDFPAYLYAMASMAPGDPRLDAAYAKLKSLAGTSFYPCVGSIPKFKGPGPKGGMCPYANLLAARAFSARPEQRACPEAKLAAGALLDHWEHRQSQKPFLFGMGADFKKLKFPFVWYNILHVIRAIGKIEGVADDPRFKEMTAIVAAKLDAEGRATPESVHMAYKGEEWAQKKVPSRLMTVLVHRSLRAAACGAAR
jgi:hypothetical protein